MTNKYAPKINSKTGKPFNVSLLGLYNAKSGSGNMTTLVNEDTIERLKYAITQLEAGGRLLLKPNARKSSPNQPDWYLEFTSAEEVRAFQNKQQSEDSLAF